MQWKPGVSCTFENPSSDCQVFRTAERFTRQPFLCLLASFCNQLNRQLVSGTCRRCLSVTINRMQFPETFSPIFSMVKSLCAASVRDTRPRYTVMQLMAANVSLSPRDNPVPMGMTLPSPSCWDSQGAKESWLFLWRKSMYFLWLPPGHNCEVSPGDQTAGHW